MEIIQVIRSSSTCIFCSAQAKYPSSEITTEEYWPYVQPTAWTGVQPLRTPPMCSVCSGKIEEVAKCHRKIKHLEHQLNTARKKLDVAVQAVPGATQKTTATAYCHHDLGLSSKALKRTSKTITKIMSQHQQLQLVNMTTPDNSGNRREASGSKKRSVNEMTGSSKTKSATENDSIPHSDPDAEIESGAPDKKILKEDSSRMVEDIRNSPSATETKVGPSASKETFEEDLKQMEIISDEQSLDFGCKLEDVDDDNDSVEYYDVPSGPSEALMSMEMEENNKIEIALSSSEDDDDDDDDVEEDVDVIPGTRERAPRSRSLKQRRKVNERICLICSVKLPLSALHQHMKDHVGDYAFQCPHCSVTFPSRLSFSFHHSKHRVRCTSTEIRPSFNCETCGENVRYGWALRHLSQHETSKKSLTCPIPSCGKTCTWKQSLELHLGSEHETKAIRNRKKYSWSKLSLRGRECEICGESIPLSITALHEHMISHVGDMAFQCPMEKCRLTFASRYSSKCQSHHLKCRKGKGSYCKWDPLINCEQCNEQFDSLLTLRPHLRRHEIASEKNFTCPIPNCGKEFTIKQSLEFHLSSHSFRRTLQNCCLCPAPTKRMAPNEMEAHLKDVHDKIVIKCGKCPFVFSSQEDLVEHLTSHVKSGIKCHLCSSNDNDSHVEVFISGRKLRSHFFDVHQIGRRYLCERCDYTAGCLETLRLHKSTFHMEKGQGRRQELFHCEICEDKPTFSSADVLKTHKISTHGVNVGMEKFRCGFCPEEFFRKKTRDDHEKYMHRGVERTKFPCPECQMVLTTKKGLSRHLDSKHSTTVYSCKESGSGCEKTFNSRESLRRHVKRDHAGERFVCQTCGNSFKDRQILATHMRIHTGERPYLCKLCGMNFRQQSSLYNHSKGHERRGDLFVPKGTFDRTEKRTE